MNLNFKLL